MKSDIITITRGSEKIIPFTLRYGVSKKPYDLTGKTVSIKYRNAAGTIQTLVSPAVTITSLVYGEGNFKLTSAQTNDLEDCEFFDFDIYITSGGEPTILTSRNQVMIEDSV